MTSCLLLGDIHITDDARRPSSRKPGYEQQILDKLQFCVEKANDLDVPVISLGDVFHCKASSKNTHRLVQRVHEVFKEANNGVWVVPGNHCMVYDRLESLSSQPLGALCRMRNVELLIGETVDLLGIAGVPWIAEFDGGSWERALDEKWDNFGIKAEIPTLLCTHAPIFPHGKAPGVYASITPDEFADYWFGIVACAYGHIHSPEQVFMDSKGYMQFANFGALSRGSLHEETVNRKLQISYWDGITFTGIDVPCKEPEEVFLFDEAIQKKISKANAEEFSNLVGTVSIPRLTIEKVQAMLKKQASSQQVYDIIEQILER